MEGSREWEEAEGKEFSPLPMHHAQSNANFVTAIPFISRVICNYPPIA